MTLEEHCRRLEKMYQAAPVNRFYSPVMQVSEGFAEITIQIVNDFFHAANAVHGSVYFKMLDDAAYFAANSLEKEFFVVTSSFTTYLTRPISSGYMRSEGRVVNRSASQFIAEAVVYNSAGKELGRGSGIFVRSKNRLLDIDGYR